MAFREMPSAVAGSTMAPGRQEALRRLRQLIQEDPQDRRRRYLKLVPEPTNRWDADAVQVMARVPGFPGADAEGWFQIGYVKNGQTLCKFCESTHAAFPKGDPPRCPRCKSTGLEWFERVGTATKLTQEMRKDPHGRFYAVVTEVTGGDQAKGKDNLGCNILICKAVKKETRAEEAPPQNLPQPLLAGLAESADDLSPQEIDQVAKATRPKVSHRTPPPAIREVQEASDRVYSWDDFEDA